MDSDSHKRVDEDFYIHKRSLLSRQVRGTRPKQQNIRISSLGLA